MSEKDPAFLMYSKDWLEGTMEMLPEEKGVYIDLLCHQHQKGSLPTDTKRLARLVGLGEQEFLFIWGGIQCKFFEENHRLYNRKLTKIVTERSEKGEKNKIIGTLAAVFRLSKAPYELKIKAKSGFNYKTFIGFTDHFLTEAITKWFDSRLKSIEDGNANEDGNIILEKDTLSSEGTKEGGMGETNPFLVPKMQMIWYDTIPTYTKDISNDYPAIIEIYKFIASQAKLKDITNPDTQERVLGTFQMIAIEANEDDFWRVKPLKSIAKNIQEFYNRIKDKKNGQSRTKSKTNGFAKHSDADIKAALTKSFEQRR